ncbi:hypothetical protein C8J56DRAFT_360933 [Mycena floridula]|nr:hypothetical protein C8J56DRAFT_360933 [Mycena floridula]
MGPPATSWLFAVFSGISFVFRLLSVDSSSVTSSSRSERSAQESRNCREPILFEKTTSRLWRRRFVDRPHQRSSYQSPQPIRRPLNTRWMFLRAGSSLFCRSKKNPGNCSDSRRWACRECFCPY